MWAADSDDSNEALKRQIEDEHPEWRVPRDMPKPIRDVLQAMLDEKLPVEDYSHDPWWIARVAPNAYRTAAESLKREGFESYSPTYKVIGPLPLRHIPPKKRHQAALYKREIRRRQFDGYMFIRRMFGHFDINRLFDLEGCGAVVRSAGSIALIPDYDIELMRLIEADGSMNEVQVETYKGYKVTKLDDQQWVGTSKIVGRLDGSTKTVIFVERMGRIARLITEADPR